MILKRWHESEGRGEDLADEARSAKTGKHTAGHAIVEAIKDPVPPLPNIINYSKCVHEQRNEIHGLPAARHLPEDWCF